MFGLSKEQMKVLFTNRCPAWRTGLAGKRTPDYFKADGTQLARVLNLLFTFPPPLGMICLRLAGAAVAECLECRHCWPLFAGSKIPASGSSDFGNPRMDTIVETTRSEEPLGEERRLIDNSKSIIALERRFTVTKEWSQSCILEQEKTRDRGGGLTIGAPNIASITATAKAMVTTHYTISEEMKRTYTEEITLSIPANTKLTVHFLWKRIWQHGVIKIYDGKGTLHELPFRVTVGLTFDQTQVDDG